MVSVSIINTTGQLVYQSALNATDVEIDISGYEPGIYMVQTVDQHGRIAANRLIIQ
jgi:hypothetical protein